MLFIKPNKLLIEPNYVISNAVSWTNTQRMKHISENVRDIFVVIICCAAYSDIYDSPGAVFS